MKNTITKFISFLMLTAFVMGACQKEFTNPSTTIEEEAVKSLDGLIALCNGLQNRFTIGGASPLYASVAANGLTTKELKVLNAGNTNEGFLSVGNDALQGNNSVITNVWEQCNLVKANAELILRYTGNIEGKADKASVIAYAQLYKALALGTMANFWQQIAIQVPTFGEDARFSTREAALEEAIKALEAAAAEVPNLPAAGVSTKFVGGIDFPNTIQALIARYANMLGQNDKAITAAGKVDLTKKSEIRFDDLSPNPVFFVSLSNANVLQPTDSSFGLVGALRPAFNDGRVLFYLQSKTPGANNVWRGKGFWTANNSPVPVYLPGEMLLIRAEAFARKDMIPEAIAELNKVLTKANDVYGVNAKLPVYSGAQTKDAVLEQIYRNRCIELFMSGLKLDDSRRFGRQASPSNLTERNRDWYPYPFNERDNNPNTPTDPTF